MPSVGDKCASAKDKQPDTKGKKSDTKDERRTTIVVPGGTRRPVQGGTITLHRFSAFLRRRSSSPKSVSSPGQDAESQGLPALPSSPSFESDALPGCNYTDENGQSVGIERVADWIQCEVERRVSEALHERVNGQRTISDSPSERNTPSPSPTEGFSELNEAIASLCKHAAGEALKSCPFDGIVTPTTNHVKDKEAFAAAFPKGNSVPSMIRSELNSPRPLHHAINYGLRSIISTVLHQKIFDPFHPSLIGGEVGAQRSDYLKGLYYKTRFEEDDVEIKSWRAGTYKAHEVQEGQDFSARFIETLSSTIIKDKIDPFFQAIFGKPMNIIELRDISTVVRVAFDWNKSIKCLVPSIDLRTFVVDNNAAYEPRTMEYYETPMDADETEGTPINIICAGSIGLERYDRENPGGQILVKVKVLTPQNYGDT